MHYPPTRQDQGFNIWCITFEILEFLHNKLGPPCPLLPLGGSANPQGTEESEIHSSSQREALRKFAVTS
jgi:hypothetical protein